MRAFFLLALLPFCGPPAAGEQLSERAEATAAREMAAGLEAQGRQLQRREAPAPRAPGLYARVATDAGPFTIRLFESEAPKTVANFVGLAEGTIDPATGKPGEARPFYDGLTFHRAVRGFLIQGGDPHGDGTGGPGYRVPNEVDKIHPLPFDHPGLVAMASDAANKNGSQFFITLAAAPSLTGRSTIFGEVVDGMDVVRRIGEGKTLMLPPDRLAVPVKIDRITIERISD